jgi:hypothetical protein
MHSLNSFWFAVESHLTTLGEYDPRHRHSTIIAESANTGPSFCDFRLCAAIPLGDKINQF